MGAPTVAQAGTRGLRPGFISRNDPPPTTLDVAELQKEADQWAGCCREVDVRLRQLNWSTELME